jgi:hypothetical protein
MVHRPYLETDGLTLAAFTDATGALEKLRHFILQRPN